MEMTFTLSVLPDELAICRFNLDDRWSLPQQGSFMSVTRTEDEISVVCPVESVSEDARVDEGWRALKVHGPIPFEMTGVLASIINPLADAKIPVFAMATFDTDYVLVRQETLERAAEALRKAGHLVLL